MNRYVCIHGHFYQPPRENPWLEEVELQDSAYPYHDWNERITAECYAPNTASRLLDAQGRITDIVNNYAKISFNFGPTLLSWMERHAPEVHQALVEADRESRKHFSGHGSAIAQVYNHMIMPLASARDKRTQVIWGKRDFEHRFGREPEGMWLAETGVDIDTLEVLAELGIAFTILAPRQAGRVRQIGGDDWIDVSDARVDPKMPYLCRLPSGKTISLFFYDGPISQELAFAGLLSSGEKLASRLLGAFVPDREEPQLVHVATDGETYGHHHRFGDMALVYCLNFIESNNLARITIYGEYLEQNPPVYEVEILENTSWSCAHGVERWQSHCGCNTGRDGWTQEWRSPLRASLNWLREELAALYEREAARYLKAPWRARDDYIEVILDRSEENVARYLSRHRSRELSREETVKALRLLEMQRHTMLMFTSCGWFFDELSGLEGTQVLQYAARAIQLAEKVSGVRLEPSFLEILQGARSNVPDYANGAEVYEKLVRPATVDLPRVGAHYAVSSLFEEYQPTDTVYAYTVQSEAFDRDEAGRLKLAVGRARMRSTITWDERLITFAVLHLGDHNLVGGVRDFSTEAAFESMSQEIKEAYERSDLPETIRLIDKHFETHNYSLWHLFKDEQRKVFGRILESTLGEVEGSFRQIYDHHYSIMQVMRELQTPIPKALLTTAEFTVNANLRRLLEGEEIDLVQLRDVVGEFKRYGFEADRTALGFIASRKINSMMERLSHQPEDLALLESLATMLRTLAPLGLGLNLWKAQNLHFSLGRQLYAEMREMAEKGEQAAQEWLKHFDSLGHDLRVASA